MPESLPAKFPCPACHVPLRLRDRRFLGANFPCPECGILLTLLELEEGTATVRRVEEIDLPDPSNAELSPSKQGVAPVQSRSRSGLKREHLNTVRDWVTSPLVISWGVAIVFGSIMIGLIVTSGSPLPPKASAPIPDPLVKGDDAGEEASLADKARWDASADDNTEQRLAKLGRRLLDFEQKFGEFPPGVVRQPRQESAGAWSWQSRLAAADSPAGVPVNFPPLQAWNDPAQERFVRRQLPEFINPGLEQLVGEQGYPTTHFVGVGGVGADAPALPVEHPRAGMFGEQRATKLADVRDGLSNTFAVMGIESRLGSWAEGGLATVRPLTAEPYLHGPDGFGTGSPGEMLVLMADGSVRAVAADTDPRLMRRMAAIADGLPLDLAVPGEPGDAESDVRSNPLAQVIPALIMNAPDNPPISALAVHAPGPVSIMRPRSEAVLSQRLLNFDQSQPVARRELLSVLEDLLGRPIRWPENSLGAEEPQWDEPITIQLRNATVAELFAAILDGTDWKYDVDAEAIRLKRSMSSR